MVILAVKGLTLRAGTTLTGFEAGFFQWGRRCPISISRDLPILTLRLMVYGPAEFTECEIVEYTMPVVIQDTQIICPF